MGSLFIKISVVAALTTTLFLESPAFSSATPSSTNQTKPLKLDDAYYPEYPKTAPATGEKQKLIERGEYLAKMGDCIACHTDAKAKTGAYAGGLPLNTPFGTFYSPNITPDKETGIGNWTEQDFIRALKEGRDPHGRNYFPVFPYIYFSKISDEDAGALYAYFMSVPPIHLQNKSLPFPLVCMCLIFEHWFIQKY